MSAYLDGEVAAPRIEQIRAHTKGCTTCSDELHELELSFRFIESHARQLDAPRAIWGHVRARITYEAPAARTGLFQFFLTNRWLTAAALVAVVAVLSVGAWSFMQYRQSERDLEQYMGEYIRNRELQEQTRRFPEVNLSPPPRSIIYLDYEDNPFMTIRANSADNPFRSEGR
jgi:hypothetical protein